MIFGNKTRNLREKKGLVLRQIAAALEVDTATISKIERGYRQAKEEQLPLLAKILNTNLEELKTLWLAEKVYHIIKEEENAIAVLNVVEQELTNQVAK